MHSYLNLGNMPLANGLEETVTKAIHSERYPLNVMLCRQCGLSQLSVVVNPELLFSKYVYRSSVNGGYLRHCNAMAVEFKERFNLHASDTDFGSFVIDIAGNDGALLSEFSKVIPGMKSLNIDPASNLVEANESLGVRQYVRFWSTETAQSLDGLGWPKADVITGTNVFAHVDDTVDFLHACRYAIKPDGVIVLEFPYLLDFMANNEFDTIYHEHLSYFSLNPILKMCRDLDLQVFDCKKIAIHGGTLRVYIQNRTTSIHPANIDAIDDLIIKEGIGLKAYDNFASAIGLTLASFEDGMRAINGTVAAFSASAKGNTLLNCVTASQRIKYIVDETPEKQNKFTPGVGLPVVGLDVLRNDPPDYLIILSWNFADEIMKKCSDNGYIGKFVIPIPYWEVIG